MPWPNHHALFEHSPSPVHVTQRAAYGSVVRSFWCMPSSHLLCSTTIIAKHTRDLARWGVCAGKYRRECVMGMNEDACLHLGLLSAGQPRHVPYLKQRVVLPTGSIMCALVARVHLSVASFYRRVQIGTQHSTVSPSFVGCALYTSAFVRGTCAVETDRGSSFPMEKKCGRQARARGLGPCRSIAQQSQAVPLKLRSSKCNHTPLICAALARAWCLSFTWLYFLLNSTDTLPISFSRS